MVHGTNFTVPPTRGAARVLTVHDLTPVRFPELCDPASLAYPAQIRAALSAGAWIHTPSTYVAQEVIEAFGADPARVRAVASGTPGPLERLARSESRSSAPAVLPTPVVPTPALPTSVLAASELPNGVDRYVLAVGTAEPRKDLPGLVGAFDRLAGGHPELALVLAGPDGWGTAALDSAVAQAIHRNRIVRTGWVDDRILDGLLAGAALLAYPSVYEGFGFPPLQAMAAGVPVVATRAGALPEVLGDAALLVPVGQPDVLADALARVLDDPVVAASLVAKGRLRAAGFTWDRCAQGLVELYRDAVAERR